MLWGNNVNNANAMPMWRVNPELSNQNLVYLNSSTGNTSANSIAFTATASATSLGLAAGWFIYNTSTKVALGTVATVTGTAVTTVASLPVAVAASANLSFSKYPTNYQLFENISANVDGTNVVHGIYGVTPLMANIAHTAHSQKKISPGWYSVRTGMGPATNITIAGGGTLYSNNDLIKITSTIAGTTNCSANVVTNGSGVIQATSYSINALSNGGGMFVNTGATSIGITTSTGSGGATPTFSLGGRANRVWKECLVSMGSTYDPTNTHTTSMFPRT